MQRAFRFTVFTVLLLSLVTLACGVPGLTSTPTPVPSPTPEGDVIFFTAPYTVNLAPGTTIPGTQIRYEGPSNGRYEITIDGLQTLRQVGDSLPWQGIIAPGVHGDYQLRLKTNFRGQLQAEGNVNLAILDPAPVELPPTSSPAGALYFGDIPVRYTVPEDARVPGTTLIYEGQQNQVAELSGTASYPFFALNDSLVWLGNLRSNVLIRYDMTVSRLDASGLGLDGTAELWITE